MRSEILPLLAAALVAGGCQDARRGAIKVFDQGYTPALASEALAASWTGKDLERDRVEVRLTAIAEGLTQPVDFAFVGDTLLVAEKTGALKWFSTDDGASGALVTLEVLTVSEQGLLGLALHPDFAENGRLFLNYTVASGGDEISRVQEWILSSPGDPGASTATAGPVVMEVVQPYQNHNAGDLAFGPDGMLYIGWGDGGFRYDPHDHGQNRSTRLGAMLRVDVDSRPAGAGYGVPDDNPFAGQDGALPELWAYGLRNPWRYTFAPDGRMIVADVGQDLFEEVSVVRAGANLGWKIREGFGCYEAGASAPAEGCASEGLTPPIYQYDRTEGQSITGGEVYTGDRLPALKGRYLFADFISGRIWALALPDAGRAAEPLSLGQWPLLIAGFGRDSAGEIYVAAYGKGAIYRLDPRG